MKIIIFIDNNNYYYR